MIHKPVIILLEPQLGENIGMAARAMGNCGLHELRLVNPREEWPNEQALRAAAGAAFVVEKAKVFTTLSAAVADLDYIVATTVRSRRLEKNVFTAKELALNMKAHASRKTGILFGPEKYGLSNDHISLCNAVLCIPTDVACSSLNLAQAVLLCAYEWYQSLSQEIPKRFTNREGILASKEEVTGFLEHLIVALEEKEFFRPPHKKKRMTQNLCNIFQRIDLTQQETRTLRGVVRALTDRKRKRKSPLK